jgi:hypothetical protein
MPAMTPLLAILEITDFIVISLIFLELFFLIYVFGGLTKVNHRPDLRRLDRKLDALLKQQGISLPPIVSEDVQRILRDPTKKPEAVKLHREQAGLDETDATADVEAFLAEKD